jgi:hypothetical protein
LEVVQIALNLDYIPKNSDEICDSWMKNPKNKISNLLIFGCGGLCFGLFGEPEMIGFLVKKF